PAMAGIPAPQPRILVLLHHAALMARSRAARRCAGRVALAAQGSYVAGTAPARLAPRPRSLLHPLAGQGVPVPAANRPAAGRPGRPDPGPPPAHRWAAALAGRWAAALAGNSIPVHPQVASVGRPGR